MPAGVSYDVNAFLKTQGSFQKEMAGAARGADRLGKSYGSMSDRLVSAGERVRGSFAATARELGRGALLAGAAGLAGAVAMAAREGIRFNSEMEQGALGLGTMYTTFGLMEGSADVMNGKMSLFAKSTEQAESMQQSLFDIAKKSPATFEQVVTAYKSMAPSISGITGDLTRQRDLMEDMSLLGFATGGDYKQLGMDIGRISKGMAEMDNLTFQQLRPAFEKAFESVTGDKAVNDFNAQWNKAAKLDPDQALQMIEMVGKSLGPEVSDAFGKSFGGMAATIQSQLQVIAGAFGKPLMKSMKKAMSKVAGEESPLDRLDVVARFAGEQLGKAADKLFAKMISGAEYVANNWMMIATRIQEAGVLAGAALKAASVIATTRLVAGYGMIAVGKGAAAAKAVGAGGRVVGGAMRKRATGLHMGIARGMKGQKGGGMAGGMGRGLGKVFGKLDAKGVLGIFKGFDSGLLKIATMVPMILTAGAAAAALGLAFSGVAVIVGGLAAHVIGSWESIKTALVEGFRDGTISLVPLITSLYTFYERLRLAGQALFGTIDATGAMVGGISMLTGAFDFASTVIGGTITAIALMIGAWAALKSGMLGVMKMVLAIGELGAKVGAVDASAIERGKANVASFESGVDSTIDRSNKLRAAAERISNATLDPMQLAAAEKKAKGLEGALADMLSGKDKDTKKGRGRTGRQTKVDANIIINTNDPDVDRIMAGIINWGERASDKRTQAYEGPSEQGF